jgi:hypothetical protein
MDVSSVCSARVICLSRLFVVAAMLLKRIPTHFDTADGDDVATFAGKCTCHLVCCVLCVLCIALYHTAVTAL